MSQIPGAWIETMQDPCAYSIRQIEVASTVAALLNRGRFVLCVKPDRR